jgi:hypothetical protein
MEELKVKLHTVLSAIRSLLPKPGYQKSTIRPAKDWQYTLIIFFITLVIIVGVGIYIYSGVLNESFWNGGTIDQSNQVNTINQKNLNAVTSYFSQKAINLQTIQNSAKVPADPSL